MPSAAPLYILGGRTRLARALFDHATAAGHAVRVLFEDEADRLRLSSLYPSADSLTTDLAAASGERVVLAVCALGPVHPGAPMVGRDAQRLVQQAALLERLALSTRLPLHLVLVSSVVALAPPRDRSYYAGFKGLAESVCAAALRSRTDCCLSVIYPGRLVRRRGGDAGPTSWLATSYSAAARAVLRAAATVRGTSVVLGLDARLWLAVGGCRLWGLAAGRAAPVVPSDRDVAARHGVESREVKGLQ